MHFNNQPIRFPTGRSLGWDPSYWIGVGFHSHIISAFEHQYHKPLKMTTKQYFYGATPVSHGHVGASLVQCRLHHRHRPWNMVCSPTHTHRPAASFPHMTRTSNGRAAEINSVSCPGVTKYSLDVGYCLTHTDIMRRHKCICKTHTINPCQSYVQVFSIIYQSCRLSYTQTLPTPGLSVL